MRNTVLFRALLNSVRSGLGDKVKPDDPNRDQIIMDAAMTFIKQAELEEKRG